MKSVVFSIVAAVAAPAFAAPASTIAQLFDSPAMQQICADTVTPHPTKPGFWHLERPRFALTDETLYTTMHLRPNADGEYAVVSVSRANPETFTEVARYKDPISDLKVKDGQLFVLFSDKVVALSAGGGPELFSVSTAAPTTSSTAPAAPKSYETSHAMTFVGDRLVIANGSRGLGVLDTQARTLSTTGPQVQMETNGQLSAVTYITSLNDHTALAVVDNVSVSNKPPFPFNGLMLVDLNGQTTKLPYDVKSSGSLSNAIVKTMGDTVVINNWGILQLASLSRSQAAGKVDVQWKPVKYTLGEEQLPAELMGDFLIENDTVYSCGQVSFRDPHSNRPFHSGIILKQPLK